MRRRPIHWGRKELQAIHLFEQSCDCDRLEERAALIAGAFLPTLIRRKALRMLAVEKDAAVAFNETDPSATGEAENGAI